MSGKQSKLDKRLNKLVAGLPGVRHAVEDAAKEIQRDAKLLAHGHGSLPEHIHLRYPNRYDTEVTLTHTAALSIEHGHDDAVFGSGWVPGLHIMRDAAHGRMIPDTTAPDITHLL